MKHCLVFASLISPSKMILFEKKYQTFDTVFHHQMKHLGVRQKYSAARRIFNSLLGVSSGDETLHLMFDILRKVEMRKFDRNSLRIKGNTNFKKKLTSFVSKSVLGNPAMKVKVATEIRRHTAGAEAVVFRPFSERLL